MDAVTRSLMKEFAEQNGFAAENEATLFEHFVNYLITVDSTGTDFEVETISTGNNEFGIDGIGIIVNDILIEDDEQLSDIIDSYKILEVSFYFIQSKSTSGFDAGEILKFSKAVKNFFFDNATLNGANERIKLLHSQFELIYEHAAKFSRGLPSVHMYYVSTGTWKGNELLKQLIDSAEAEFIDSNMFREARIIPVDATKIQSLYFKSKNAIRAEVEMPVSVPMPNIKNIRESYIGVISAKEYLNLILDEKGDVIKKVFFDNLRDFQGETEVNRSIGGTLQSEFASQFPLRNNGVTVVARNLNRVGNKYVVEDYQIVNGCQSSHVLAAHRDALSDDVFCPIKIISTDDEESIREIIISSNRQNEISADGFWILDEIHKKLEVYFGHNEIPLFYERRSGQYNIQENIEKTKIVNKDILLKSFSAMFLSEINRV